MGMLEGQVQFVIGVDTHRDTHTAAVCDPTGAVLTKENPGCWTRRRAFAQVRHGSNIQLLPYSLVSALLTFS